MALSFEKVKHYTPQELAEILNLSPAAVRKLVEHEPDVVRMGHPGLRAGKQRRYVTLRIPEQTAERIYRRLTKAS